MSIAALSERRTSADVIFEHLYDEIMSLAVMPGSKMSEADVADQFGVSRQPVREAFNRLGQMGLLHIQPQRATLVQKFSLHAIETARFVRLALEIEIAREAVARWSDEHKERFADNLALQEKAVETHDSRRFHTLDAEFHRLIANVAGRPEAYDLAREKKAMVDRLCVLSLKNVFEMQELVSDHRTIFEGLLARNAKDVETAFRRHLARIDKTITAVREAHADYFDD